MHRPLLLVLLLCLGPRARAQQAVPPTSPASVDTADAPPPTAAADAPPLELTAEARLDAAVSAYQSGQLDLARERLAALVMDNSVSDLRLRQEARVYLGEVFLGEGKDDDARRVWELVLAEDPDYRVDPFRHPPEVVARFEVVRAYTVRIDKLPPTAVLPPLRPPRSVWLGFGAYQLAQGETGKGVLLLTAEAGLGVASLAGFAALARDRTCIAGTTDCDALYRTRNLQWAATTGMLVVHVTSVALAGRSWQGDAAARLGVGFAPSGLGGMVVWNQPL
jgi:hypothetical protein